MPAARRRRLVALDQPPGDAFITALEAAWERGDAVLPVDPRAPSAAIRTLTDSLGVGEPVEDDTALVIATSGSTGRPKGATLRREALAASARATHARIGLEADDVWLSCLPWHHIGGLQVLLRSRLLGIRLIVHPAFAVDAVRAAPATLVSLVPTQLARLLQAKVDLGRFRAILLGGSAAAPALLAQAREHGAHVVTTYGMSETAGGCVYDGLPLDGVAVRITDEQRIAIRGPMLMSGYRTRDPEPSRHGLDGGWFVTSDLGELEESGRLRVLGRVDDVIVTGGENVVASQVAAVVRDHPAIEDALVVGVADPEWGQRVVAVVSGAGAAAVRPADLREWCRDRLPPAWLPRDVFAVDSLPMLASGKPDRLRAAALAAAASAGQAAPAGDSHSADPASTS